MASRTQLRLGQITGSFADVEGGIVDNLAFDSSSTLAGVTLNSGSMVGVLSEIASSIKRINGAATFAGATAGEFGHAIVPDSDLGQDLGTSSVHWGTLHVGQVDATGITGSVRDTSISANQVAHANAQNTLVGDANFTFDGTTLTLGSSQDLSVGRNATVAGNATITGNLTVNGTTTTVNSTTLTVDDRFIFLADGAQSTNTDAGIAFASASNESAKPDVVFAKINGANNTFGLGAMNTQSGSIANTTENGGADFTVMTFRAGKFEVDGTSNTLDVVSSDLTVVAGQDFVVDAARDIILDAGGADVFFKDDGTTIGKITNSSNVLLISGGNGAAMTLDANSGEVNFDQGGTRYATLLKDGTGFELTTNASGDNSFKIGANGGGNADIFAGTAGMVRLGVGGDHILNMTASAGSVQIRAGAGGVDTNDIIFTNESYGTEIFRVDTSAHTLAMPQQNAAGNDATAGLLSFNGTTDVNEAIYGDGGALYLRSNAVNFKMPTADAAASGYALVSDAAGTLSFAAVGADATEKAVRVITGSAGIPAGTALSLVTAEITVGAQITGMSTASTQGKSLDVFVNGQLLVSGSGAERTAGTRDYEVSGAQALKFAFALEADDVVQVIKR